MVQKQHDAPKDFDAFIKNKPLIDEEELLVAVNDDQPLKLPENDAALEDIEKNETKDIPATVRLPAEISAKKKQEQAVQTAAADIVQPPQSLIPLEYGDKLRGPERQIEIAGRSSTAGQVALAGSEIPISSMNAPAETDKADKEPPAARQWQTMAEKHSDKNDAWLIAKGARHPKNTMVLEQKYNQTDDKTAFTPQTEHDQPADKETQVAELSKNLLIPIPEEIMQEKNLIPRLGSSPHNREIEDRLIEKELQERGIDTAETTPSEAKTASEDKEKKSSGILSGITSLFKSEDKKDNKNVNIIENPGESYDENGGSADIYDEDQDIVPFLDKIKDSFRKKFYTGKILPAEIRLAFQPNRAEISGQTLNWLEAFANKTREDATTGLEIRIDGTSSRILQQKRLNLLYNILANKGVEYGKIKIVFTSREPNSFIIRTVKIKNDFDNGGINNAATAQGGYYMRW